MKINSFQELSTLKYLWYSLIHPNDGFFELKYNRKTSPFIIITIVFLWMVEELFSRVFTDYDLNIYADAKESLFKVALVTIIAFIIAVISNWSFCTLLNGKGKAIEIATVFSYALVPYIITKFVIIALSYYLTSSADSFLKYLTLVMIIWGVAIAFCGLKAIHEYTFFGTLASVFLTILGVIIILFICLVFVQLWQQIINFISIICLEISYR